MTGGAPDPRINPFRPDLAAEHLAGRVDAPRFVAGTRRQVARGVVDLRRGPSETAPLDTQLLGGEAVTVYDQADGWAWLQNDTDGYVGYAARDAIAGATRPPTHVVRVLRTFLFPEPDLKAPPLDALVMTGSVAVTGERDRFCEVAGGWVYGRHLAPIDEPAPDYVATAVEFLGAPYLWGGKTSLGLDCSALVQVALHRAGRPCPRDSDQQAAALGRGLSADATPARGDLIYFPDHVAIALDEWRVIHANALDMLVAIEPLADLAARIEQLEGQGITAIRRLDT